MGRFSPMADGTLREQLTGSRAGVQLTEMITQQPTFAACGKLGWPRRGKRGRNTWIECTGFGRNP
jgi:hypothetical protein